MTEKGDERILRRAREVFGSAEVAKQWFDTESLRELRGRTAAQAAEQGHTEAVLRLLDLIAGGFIG